MHKLLEDVIFLLIFSFLKGGSTINKLEIKYSFCILECFLHSLKIVAISSIYNAVTIFFILECGEKEVERQRE